MKRTASLLLAAVMALALMPLSLAAEYQDANWLYADWDINGYPDDVGGVFSYDGDGTHLCIMLVGDDGTREGELRAMLENDENLRFAACTRTYNELAAIKGEIESAYMNETYGVNGCGIGMLDDRSDCVVTVMIAPERFEETSKLFYDKYGEAVALSDGSVSDATAEDTSDKDAAKAEPLPEPTEADRQRAKRQLVTYMIVYTIVVAGMAFALYYRRKKKAEERK